MNISISNIEDLPRAAAEFVAAMGDNRHFAFHAPMGAGKTTFISALCAALGSEDEASSPTFSIVNEYAVAPGGSDKIYHFDFYRVETVEELLDMGLDDYWDSGSVCLMEWPENALGFLPDDTVDVRIEVLPDDSRMLTV
ncbi:tRNA (adenosine(37)-N6)-threonylcarbamoyltransferase complex ATPase subunit type 1 TsaE [Sangeribacter muris]|uniref:tRNA (adenosine(37)-N6)-threonylcarbamoyltransferase complex ATPase subunit type 1 TsaE n=1 Tax=Sangeribacter muris TaxID=2880703 RepID=UPI00244DF3A2|nr:tRNA (adenosine(37)-N6)-threonylcarbamoyltransferase complex ATPase subunit type 1 TsaE [Sangeribacter muris]